MIDQNQKKLKDYISTTKGFAFKSSWYSDKGMPLVKVSNFTENSIDTSNLIFIPDEIAEQYKKVTLLKDDVVIQTVGSYPSNPQSVVGKVIRVPASASGSLLNQNAVKVKPNIHLHNKFLYYLLKNDDFKHYILGTARGAANQASITLESIYQYQFHLHPLPTQRKIATILSTYDDLIENNTRRIKILEEIAQAIYREWFVHFRFPGHESVRMVESELGMIPEGWEVRKLGDVIELLYGKGLKTEDRKEGDIPVFGSSGIVGYHNQALVKGPGIIIGRKGNVGSVYWSDIDFFPIDTVYYTKSSLPFYYLFYNLKRQNFINNDAAVPGLNRNQAYSLPIIIPDSQSLEKFENILMNFFVSMKIISNKNINLRRTRDLLLPNLISGELDVSELDIKIPEAMT